MLRHFLKLSDWTREELIGLLNLADQLKAKQHSGESHHILEGRTLAMIFEKSSTRTRVSFEGGMTQLGGHAIMLSSANTQIGRGEPLRDTARVLSRYVDAIMIRTFDHDDVEELANWSSVPVINGLTDLVHPCQVMADLMTIRERRGDLDDLTVAWIGDGNNMAHSWILAAQVIGFTLKLACPPEEEYRPAPELLAQATGAGAKIEVATDPEWAATDADVVTTDVWASMGQEEEAERRKKAFVGYTVDEELMTSAKEDAIFLHCLPAHRGEEVSEGVLEGPHSAVWDEAENRLHAQKAIMVRLITDNIR